MTACIECVMWIPGIAAEPESTEEVVSASPQAGKEPAAMERIEDIHKPSIVAFHTLIDTFIKARQLK